MLFGSLVELHTWLHSCLYFSPLKKLFLKSWLDTSSISSYLLSLLSFFLLQSRQHLDTWWINRESFWLLDSFSTPSGSIKKVSNLSIAPRHLVDRSSIISCFWCFYSLTASRHMICRRCFFLTPSQQMSWHHLDTSPVEIYWWSINSPRAICNSFLSISLTILQTFHILNLSHSLQTSSLGFLNLYSILSSLGKLLIYFIYMHFMFWNLGFGVFFINNFFGVFQNWWNIVEILG